MDAIKSIDELASSLTRDGAQPFTLFVGSMISCTSPAKAPSVKEIRDSLFEELRDVVPEKNGLKKDVVEALGDEAAVRRREAIPFESLWERVARVTDTNFVTDTLKRLYTGGNPNTNHEAIAYLVRRGYIQTLLTTNYDEYVEATLTDGRGGNWTYESLNTRDRMVLRAIAPQSTTRDNFQFIKLHGTLSRPPSMAFMFSQISVGLSTDTTSEVSSLLKLHPVLFVGYGCNDWDLRRLLSSSIDSIWTSHLPSWSEIDERCRSITKHHRQVQWYNHNLRSKPADSVLVQLALKFGWRYPSEIASSCDDKQQHQIVCSLRPEVKLEILAELLDSMSLRVASAVFTEAASRRLSEEEQKRAEIAAYVTISHDMALPKQIEEGEKIRKQEKWNFTERVAIVAQLAFAYLMNGDKIPALRTTISLIRKWRRLEREAKSRSVLQHDPATCSADDRFLVDTITKAREIFAHNMLRIAWFHMPGNTGRLVRAVRLLGMRRILAWLARITLHNNHRWISASRDLASLGNFSRESAHALCLTGHLDAALEQAIAAEEALGWGCWYQWQANAIRTRGWIWLHIGDRFKRLRRYADQQAEQAFKDTKLLADKFVRTGGEMIDDRIKAFLELKRLAFLNNREFEWDDELTADLQAIHERSPQAYSRYRAISESPPRSREPLG